MDKEYQNKFSCPRLMKDSSEVDGHAETVMDYVLSWCLRWSESKYKTIKPILHNYCRHMLFKIIGRSTYNDIIIEEVNVWKQAQKIDLWVEVKLLVDGKYEWHSVLIENKYYTPIHLSKDTDGIYRSQLEVYRKKFESHYADKDNYHLHFAVITCMERFDRNFATTYDEKEIERLGFKLFAFDDIIDDTMDKDTESDIFNEFWRRNW